MYENSGRSSFWQYVLRAALDDHSGAWQDDMGNAPCSPVQQLWQVLGASPAEQKTEGASAFCCLQQLPLHPQSIGSKDTLMMQGSVNQI